MTSKHERLARVTEAAQRAVSAIETLVEYRLARDRLGTRLYDDARRELVAALVDFARQVALAAWHKDAS